MLSNFKRDLQAAKEAEQIVAKYLQEASYKVENIADLPQYYNKGDIKIILPTGDRYIEVKDDSRIADTHNILCEDEVFYKENNRIVKGNMYSDYDIYAVVSRSQGMIYFFDFFKLKQIYKRYGTFKRIYHEEQYSDCFLLEMCRAKQFGALIATVIY